MHSCSVATTTYLSILLPTILAMVLSNVQPATGYVIVTRDNLTDDNVDSPKRIVDPVIELAVAGATIALVILLAWCFCRSPFRNRRLANRPQAISPLSENRSRSESSLSSASACTEKPPAVGSRPALTSLHSSKANDLRETGSNDNQGSHEPIFVQLPGVPPPVLTRPGL